MIGLDIYNEDIKNNVLRKDGYIPENCHRACHVLSKWKNQHGGKYSVNRSDLNDSIVFMTLKEVKEQKNSHKKKSITCFRFEK